ncbi:MAG: hypothetical protein ACOYW3_10015 [Bacteroidota bacterium]
MKYLVCLLLLLSGVASFAQSKDYSKDVNSVDAIVAALYDVITGAPDQPRDWDRFRNLFKPEARLIPTSKNPQGGFAYRTLSPDDYVQLFASRIPTGFYERELSRKTESFGTVVHVFSTYETKEKKDGPVTNRGINSIQLFYDGTRYYVMNIFWCAESLGFTLPQNYLK